MKQYLLTAYDFTDPGALKRRMDVRPHHLDAANTLQEEGNYILGGAILNDDGNMIGSTMILQFENDEELEAWKRGEPYVTQGIWETIDVKPFKVAAVAKA